MLSYMRKNAGSWMIKVLLFGVCLSFVIGFGILPTLRDDSGGGVIVAQVGERRISRAEWDKAYEKLLEAYRRAYQGRLSDEMIKQMGLREMALDNLINKVLQLREASRLGLEVSKEDLRRRIRSLPYFQRDGHFSRNLYLRLLQLNRLSPGEFEEQQKEEMLIEAFQNFVEGTVKVSDAELWESYVLEKDQVSLKALVVSPSTFEKAVSAEEASLKEFFGRNSKEFLTPEKVKIAYIRVEPKKYRDQVKVYTGDIEEYYDSHADEFSVPEEIHIRQIFLRVPPGADASVRQEKRKTLEKVLERIRSGEDFARLAQVYSEDPASKKDGGDLGYVQRGKLIPEVERAAFALKPGEVSDIVVSPYGLHLIKVEAYRAAKVTPLEEVKEKIRDTLTEEKSWKLARRKAEEALWELKDKGSFPKPGSAVGGIPVAETGYFSREEPIPGLGEEKALKQEAFSLEPGAMSAVIRGGKGYYLLQVMDKKAPEIPAFEEVRDQVEKKFRQEQSVDLARKKAEAILQMAEKGTSFEKLAREKGVDSIETGYITRLRNYIPRIGVSDEILESAFELTKENPWAKRIFEVNGKFYVIRFHERRTPDRKAFLAAKKEFEKRKRSEKAQQVYRQWLAELRKREDVKVSETGA